MFILLRYAFYAALLLLVFGIFTIDNSGFWFLVICTIVWLVIDKANKAMNRS
ncbi:MAG: hypothetical protein JHC38_09910 [Thiotrichales bacterium]|jgi:hypothetical protein|nr:hypothetical protein [Thiotrichales bacterium]